jgi:excisionase family DNA binding protein
MERGLVGTDISVANSIEGKTRALIVPEVAMLLNISARQVYKLTAERRIPYLKIAGSIRFDPSCLARWLRNQVIWQQLPSDVKSTDEKHRKNIGSLQDSEGRERR